MFPAVPYNVTARFNVTTNASGATAFAVTPMASRVFYQPSVAVTAAGVVDWSTAPTVSTVTNLTPISNSFDLYRIAAWGVRIVTTSSISNTAGTLYCAYVPNYYANSVQPAFWPTSPDQVLQLPWSSMYPGPEMNTEPMIFPAKRIDPASLRFRSLFYPQSAPNQVENADGWGSFVFIHSGANAATTSFTVEIIMRTEMIPQANASVVSSGSSFPTNSVIMDRVSNVQSALPIAYVEDDSPGFMQTLIAEASSRASSAWRSMAPSLARGLVAGAAHVGGSAVNNWVRTANRRHVPRITY